MWWGGGDGDQGGGPPQSPSPEAGAEGSIEAAEVRQELGDLQEQFDQQQALIGQLKVMLKTKDSAVNTKGKEVEDYAARLAKMKPRLSRAGAKRPKYPPERVDPIGGAPEEELSVGEGGGGEIERRQGAGGGGEMQKQGGGEMERRQGGSGGVSKRPMEEKRLPSSESGSRAKILLLRKQLEENRMKFDRQQKENAEKRASMEEMKQRIERLRTEVEQRDGVIQSLQEGSSPMSDESMTQKLYQQIVYKDNTIIELTNKHKRLEEVIQEQQESLSEKDKIIEARTEAVSLIARAQDEKSIKTMEELDEVRHQMKLMQKGFVAKEQEFLTEKETLSREIGEKVKKITQLEENGRRLESLRFELSTRNAELQEKIVTIQADTKALRRQSEYERQISEEKDATLQDLKQKLVKAEAHGQKKLKSLEKQMKSLKQNGNAGEQILELQNSIAELEEEKGNLQLKLVDFDDLKANNEKLLSLRNKLEDQIKQLNNDLDSQLSAITLLESEKIKLVEGTNERENRIFDLESELSVVKTNVEEATQAKVTLDLKLCEVEEQRDLAEKAKIEVEIQMSDSNLKPMEQLVAEKGTLEESLQSMMKERDEWEAKYTSQITTVEECESKSKSAVHDMEVKTKECKRLMNILTDKENTITTMSIKLDKHDTVVGGMQKKIDEALNEIEKTKSECVEINTKFMQKCDELEENFRVMEDLQSQLAEKTSELQSTNMELAHTNETVESLTRNLNENEVHIQNLVGELNSLEDKVGMKEKSIVDHINRLEQLESEVRRQDDRIRHLENTCDEREDQVGVKSAEVDKLNHELANTAHKLESMKASLEMELNVLSTMLSDSNNQIKSLQEDVEVKDKEIQNNQIIISKYEQEICSKNLMIDEYEKEQNNLQERVSTLVASVSENEAHLIHAQSENDEKAAYILNQSTQQALLEQKLAEMQEETSTLAQNKSALEEEMSEIKLLIHQKEENLETLNSEMSLKSSELCQDVEQLRYSLEEKQREINMLELSVGSLTSQLESVSRDAEKWKSEALEKSTLLSSITVEQDSAWGTLQERDVLVAQLQEQLSTQHQQFLSTSEQLAYYHQQFADIQEELSQKTSQLTEKEQQLSEVNAQLTQTQETLNITQAQFNEAQAQLTETNSQYQNITTKFEEQLQTKSSDMESLERQFVDKQESSTRETEQIRVEFENLKSEVMRLEADLKTSKEYADNLEIGSSKIEEWASQVQGELESTKINLNSVTNEVTRLQEESISKEQRIAELTAEFSEEQEKRLRLQAEMTEAVTSQQQQQQRVESLQAELSHAVSLQQQSESEVASVSLSQQQTITQLESQILSSKQMEDQLQSTVEFHINQLQEKDQSLAELNAHIENLTTHIALKDEEIRVLQNSVVEHEEAKSQAENSLREIMETKTQLENQLNTLQSQVPSSVSVPGSDVNQVQSLQDDTAVQSLRGELAAAQDQAQFLEEECEGLRSNSITLKQQLQEARQTITQLQTSLATQSQGPAAATPAWDDWGEVDLGTPEVKESIPPLENSLVTNLQKALADKDEMMIMIQDQLKDALQQINTLTEERRVLEQQRKTSEASFGQQKQEWERDREMLTSLQSRIKDLEAVQSTLEEERQRISSLEAQLQEKSQTLNISYQAPATPIGPLPLEQQGASQPVERVDQEITQPPDSDPFAFISAPSSSQDPASWFDQPTPQPVQEEVVQQTAVEHQTQQDLQQIPYELQQQQPQPLESKAATADVNIEEVQYKLQWYEEQWGTWTGHFTQLQTTYQQSEQQVVMLTEQVMQLTQQLQELQSGTSQILPTDPSQVPHTDPSQIPHVDPSQKTPPTDPSQTPHAEISQTPHTEAVLTGTSESTSDDSTKDQEKQLAELQKLLEAAEATCQTLKEENSHMQEKLLHMGELEKELEAVRTGGSSSGRLMDAEEEVNRLRGFETQVYELQSQVQTLQYQCTAMQSKLAEAESERSRLHEVEVLYGELQACVQESETKREGSSARVQELELMVQSAESEISRLRNQIAVLTHASEAVETDRERLQTDARGLGAEMSKLDNEVIRLQAQVEAYKIEMDRLQDECDQSASEKLQLQKEGESLKTENSRLHLEKDKCQGDFEFCKAEAARLERENQGLQSENQGLHNELGCVRSELQRGEQDNNQLRSELEVMEGEHGRLRGDYEVLEGENNRVRGEYEALAQANQMTEAEKESLESEVQRITARNITITSESDHLRDEIQRLNEVSTSAESEITRLRTEIERFQLLDSQYSELEGKYSELQAQVASIETEPSSKTSETESYSLLEEVDWGAEGKIEDEHLRRSSVGDAKYLEEIEVLKNKVIMLEKEKNMLYDEVQAAKMKSGKMVQKLKLTQSKNEALSKEVQKLKAKAGGFSDLDQALEEEWKAQVERAEADRDELKQKLDEMDSEKERFLNQVDVLTAAQEHYLELKENQDATARLLTARNKELEGQVQALEWRLSELEEEREGQDQEVVKEVQQQRQEVQQQRQEVQLQSSPKDETGEMKAQVSTLQREISMLRSENERLQALTEDLEEKLESLSSENESFQAVIEKLKHAKSKAEADTSKYKSTYIELDLDHTSLKKEKEKVNEELRELTFTHDTLKAAYNSMFSEYNDLRDVCDSHRNDIGMIKGERERLVEEADSLRKQLEALHEEEEEEIIRALQEQCMSLRDQNILLHEEITALEVQGEEAKSKVARVSNALEQNLEMQKLLRDELIKKSEEITFCNTTIDAQERQTRYLKAEIAAMRTKVSQQDQADDNTFDQVEDLQAQVEQLQDINQQLQLQVEMAQASLSRLAGGGDGGGGGGDGESGDGDGDGEGRTKVPDLATATTELEAALASLHLRDLRCQQLSLEITKLLEERDALQLKLSASLRQTQELSRELSLSHQLPSNVLPTPSLNQKLAELRELNDTLEQAALTSLQAASGSGRRILRSGLPGAPPMFTPHTAPPTPTATRHADYTLSKTSREAQGTSTTLIDWIMGKSTPRVLHV